MLLWSFSFIWTRVAIESFPPVTLITLRLIIASFLLYLASVISGKFQKIKKEDIKWFLLLAFFEPYMYYIGETFGLTIVEATLASVIVSTIPLFAPIFAFILLKEKITLANLSGIIISLFGVFLVIYQNNNGAGTKPMGIALLFLAVFSAICYTTVLKKIPSYYSSVNIILYQSLFGLLYFFPTLLLFDGTKIKTLAPTSEGLFSLMMLSVFASVIAFVLFAWVVRKIGVAKANVFVNLIPVFTAIFSWLIMNDFISSRQWIGILIVISGLFVSQKERKNKLV